MSTTIKILSGLVCNLLGVLIVVLIYFSPSKVYDEPYVANTAGEDFSKKWTVILEQEGAENAYAAFKKEYAEDVISEKHRKAHQFGSLLYKAVGGAGVYICDSDYSYGCFHELIGTIILNEGTSAVFGIDEYCDISVGCQHGIGHGLLAYSGYGKESLNESLAICEELTIHDPVDGCMGGVFMEYNMRTMLTAEGVPVRSYDEAQEIDVFCSDVSEKSRSACYFWLGPWLLAASPKEGAAAFTWAAEKCSVIISIDNRFTCYKGIGYEMIIYTQSTSVAQRYCKESAPEGEVYYEVQCKGAAAASFVTNDSLRDFAYEICEGLTGDAATYCTSSFNRTIDRRITNYIYPVL